MRTVDLFSGCGGMSLGFQSAGYNIVAAFENWPAAIECYKQNFKHPVIETDLSIVDEATFVASSLSDFVDGKQYSCNMQFIDWLKSNKGFTNRAAGDIVSRIIRANKIVPIKQYTGFDYVNKLDSTKSFKSIKPVVQSQVKRAVRLYFEYLDISTKEPEVTLHDSGT